MKTAPKHHSLIMFLQLLTGIAVLACLAALFLPWYQQTLSAVYSNSDPNTITTTGTVYYQVFYFYSVPNCTTDTTCILKYDEEFIGEIPNTVGFSIWQLDTSSLPSTRLLFAICWLFQLFSALFIPFSVTKGTKSSIGSTLGLISCGSSVVLFFFLPTALYRDYGENCTNVTGLPIIVGDTPCNSFMHEEQKEYEGITVEMQWGPSFGFYIALGNIILQGIVFMIASYSYPCLCCFTQSKSMEWLYEDLFSESTDVTGYSSTLPSDNESGFSLNESGDDKSPLLLPGPKKSYNST